MKYEIFGDNLQILKIDMAPHDGIFAEAGAMVNMSGSILMESQSERRDHLRTQTCPDR